MGAERDGGREREGVGRQRQRGKNKDKTAHSERVALDPEEKTLGCLKTEEKNTGDRCGCSGKLL